jgi:hypothetical protein
MTRWTFTLLAGMMAAAFIGVVFEDERNRAAAGDLGYNFMVGSAFVLTAAPAFLLWPMTARRGRLSTGRACAFGALVVLLGSFLWSFGSTFVWSAWARADILSAVLPDLPALGEALGKAAFFTLLGSFVFGWLTFPVGIGIAWAVALWGNARLDRGGAGADTNRQA